MNGNTYNITNDGNSEGWIIAGYPNPLSYQDCLDLVNLQKKPSEKFESEMQALVDSFKDQIKKISEKTITEFYCDVAPYAELDALTNFRNTILEDIVSSTPTLYGYKQAEIRADILRNHKEEIVQLLNQDLIHEVERLKSIIKDNHNSRYSF